MNLLLEPEGSVVAFPQSMQALATHAPTVASVLVVAFLSSSLAQATVASPLSEVVEESKKPVQEQREVHRNSVPTAGSSDCSSDNGSSSDIEATFDFFEGIGSLLDFFLSWNESKEPRPAPSYSESRNESIGPMGPAAPRIMRHEEPTVFVGVKTLSVRPRDHVVAALDGFGVEGGGFVLSGVQIGAGVYWARGRVRESSQANGGIENLLETAMDLRVRAPLLGGDLSRLSGFVGVRFGWLQWDYSNSVYAVDPWGYGDEIWDDSLGNVTGYGGIGLTPIRTRSWQIGVDLSAGWRGYFRETYQGFTNDLFADAWMVQLNVEFVLTF